MDNRAEKRTLKITGLRHPVDDPVALKDLVAQRLGLSCNEICRLKILRRATDARQSRIDFVYTVIVTVAAEATGIKKLIAGKNIEEYHEQQRAPLSPAVRLKQRPVIIGCGPAGLFAAATLLERGTAPVVIEQGERISARVKTVEAFWTSGVLQTQSNVLFGEGGAGTFSDGKLTSRIKSPLKEKVLEALVAYGAPAEIMYVHRPHIGTDRLRSVLPAFVKELQNRGVQFLFNTRMTDILLQGGRVCGVVAGDTMKTDHVFLAPGHSSRDLYRLLHAKGVRLAAKDFSAGVRIEHPQEFIDALFLGARSGFRELAPADYRIAYRDTQTGRGVYSFCMCPGGYIIGCASQQNTLCTNGMSAYRRNSPWANAAIVVSVRHDDFGGASPLEGMCFQEELEQRAYTCGGGGFWAPAQRAADFTAAAAITAPWDSTMCSYRPGTRQYDLKKLLPECLHQPLERGLRHFNKKLPGFIEEGILVGVETRTSSPVRVLRDPQNLHAAGIRGLIPIGEGSGYAGGIMSSAVDGIRAALSFDR